MKVRNFITILLIFLFIFIPLSNLSADEATLQKIKNEYALVKKINDESKDNLENIKKGLHLAETYANELENADEKKKLLDLVAQSNSKLGEVLGTIDTFSTYSQYTSNAFEAADYMQKIGQLNTSDLKGSLNLVASLMKDYGGKIPILGSALEVYGKITLGLISAVDNINKSIQNMDKDSISHNDKRYIKFKDQFFRDPAGGYLTIQQGFSFIFSPDDDISYGHYIWDENADKWYEFDSKINIIEIFKDNLKLGRRLAPNVLKMMGDRHTAIENHKKAVTTIFNTITNWKGQYFGAGDVFFTVNKKHNYKLREEMENKELFNLKYVYDYSYRNWIHQVLKDFRSEMERVDPNMKALNDIIDIESQHGIKLNIEVITIVDQEIDPASDLANDIRAKADALKKDEVLEDDKNNISGFKITSAYADKVSNAAVIEFEAVRSHFYGSYSGMDHGQLLWVYKDGKVVEWGVDIVEINIISEVVEENGNSQTEDYVKYRFTDPIGQGRTYSHLYTVSFNGASQFGRRRYVVKKVDARVSSPGYEFNPASAALSISGLPPGVAQFTGNKLSLSGISGSQVLENQAQRAKEEALKAEEIDNNQVMELALDFISAFGVSRINNIKILVQETDENVSRENFLHEMKNIDENESLMEQGADVFRNRFLEKPVEQYSRLSPEDIQTLKNVESVCYAVDVLAGNEVNDKVVLKNSAFIKNLTASVHPEKAGEQIKKVSEYLNTNSSVLETLEQAASRDKPVLNGEVLDRQISNPSGSGAMETALKTVNDLSRNNRKIVNSLKGYKAAEEDKILPLEESIPLKSIKEAYLAKATPGEGELVNSGPVGERVVNKIHALYGTGETQMTIPYKNEGGGSLNLWPYGYILRYTENDDAVFIPLDENMEPMSKVLTILQGKGILVNPFTGFLYGVYDL